MKSKKAPTALFRRSALIIALGLSLGSGNAIAQDIAGNIFGNAGTESGTTVLIENQDTGTRVTATPDRNGRFNAPALPAGKYKVTLERNGQAVTSRENVPVLVGRGSEVSLVASASHSLDAIEVVGISSKGIDVSSIESRVVITADDIKRLPLAQNITAIALLAPGVVAGDSRYVAGPGNQALPSFGGSAVSENAYYINGFPVTNPLTNIGYTQLPFNGIGQIQLATGGYGAEFGRATGGVVNVVTNRGTNDFKTGGQVLYRPQVLTAAPANIYYGENRLASAGKIWQYRNENLSNWATYSAYAGGPIVKDRLFFYVSGEFVDQEGMGTNAASTASVAAQRSAWSTFDYRTPRWLAKLDWNISDNHRVELTGFSDRVKQSTAYSGFSYASLTHNNIRNGGLYQDDKTNTYIGSYTGYLTEELVLTALYGEQTTDHIKTPDAYNPACPTILLTSTGAVPGLTYPTCQFASGTIIVPGAQDKIKSSRFDLEYRLGTHTLKAGADFLDTRSITGVDNNPGGYSWTYQRLVNPNDPVAPNFGVGSPASGGGYGVNGYYVERTYFRTSSNVQVVQKAQYLKDLWQISDNVQLELGLRNEQFTNKNSLGATFAEKKSQIAPRLGISWDVNGDASMKVFGHAGRYHLAMPNNVAVRGADGALFTREDFTYTGVDPVTGAPTGLVSLGPVYSANNEFGQGKDPRTVAATDLRSHFQDAFAAGIEKQVSTNVNVGAKATYRVLRSAIDDFCDYRPFVAWAERNGIDGSGFADTFTCAMFNPGQSNTFLQDVDGDGDLERVALTAAELGYPKLERKYYALDLFVEHPFDGKWYGRVDYTFSRNWGNAEGQLLSDIGQVDVSATQAWDFPELMEYSDGLLPNHRRHQLKAYGYFQATSELLVGANLLIQSGRPRNCLGIYPDRTNDGSGYGSGYFYCNGVPVPRGTYGQTPWIRRVDFSVSYSPRFVPGLTLKANMYNVLGGQNVQNYSEQYNQGNSTSPNANFGRPVSYSQGRYMEFAARYDFSL